MTDEELVEEAAKALYRNNWGDEFTFEEDRDYWVSQARAAFAVFRRGAPAEPAVTDEMVEVAAATWAIPDLLKARKTWGDLLPRQRDGYRRDTRAALEAALGGAE